MTESTITAPVIAAPTKQDRLRLTALSVAFFALYTTLGLRRLHGFAPRSIDLGFYTQMLWSLAHGGVPMSLAGGVHPLTLHVMPVLAPLALIARVVPAGDTLVIAQAAALALAIPAAFRLGGWWGVAVAMLCPSLTAQANFDVHPDVWIIAPLLLALAFERERAFRPALIAWMVVFACRESMPVIGLVAAATHFGRDRAYALKLGTLSLVWGGLALAVMFASGSGPTGSIAAHLGHAGIGAHGGIRGIAVAAALWIAASGGIGVLSPRIALPAVALFAMNAVSAFPSTLWVTSHYAAPAFPFLIAATIATSTNPRFSSRAARSLRVVSFGLLVTAYIVAGDGPGAWNFVVDERPDRARREAYSAAVSAIAANASVAAPLRFQPALAARARVYPESDVQSGLDAVVLAADTPNDAPASFRSRLARWLAADAHLGIAGAWSTAMRLERGGDRRTVPLAQGWITAAELPPTRTILSPQRQCAAFSVPVATSPVRNAAVTLRTPTGSAWGFPGGGYWVPGIGSPGDYTTVRICGRPVQLAGFDYSWRWLTRDAAGHDAPFGDWNPVHVP